MKTVKKIFACILCAAILMTGNVYAMTFTANAESAGGTDVRAMSFNIRYLLDDPYDAITYTAAQRKKVVLDQIKAYSPDVLGVQEDTAEWKTVLTEGLSGYSVYAGATLTNSPFDASYNAIFYKTDRFTLIESGCKWLTSTPNVISSVAENIHIRRVNYVILRDKVTHTQFCFANTHLHNGMESPAQSIRAQQAEYLMSILNNVIGDREIPVILIGDFNGGTKTDTLTTVIKKQFNDARDLADTVEADVNATWNSGYSNPANYGNASRIMDHCFVSSRVSVEKFRVATEQYPDASGKMLCTSDHFPLVVDTTVAPLIAPDPSWDDESTDAYRICDAADLLAFAAALKSGESFDGKTVYLCNDIVLNEGNAAEWATKAPTTVYDAVNPTGRFSGTFDGQGYVISGLYASGIKDTGLIPYVRNTATIKNVTITNSYFSATQYASAVVAVYDANEANATFTMQNVHVEDTVINTSSTRSAGILGFIYDFTAAGVSVNMKDVTFVGGSITAGRMSGGIIGTVNNSGAYENGVALTMNRIVLDSDLTFHATTTNNEVKSGALVGNLAGFRSVNATDIYVGGTLIVVGENKNGSATLFGFIKTQNTDGSPLNVTKALVTQACTNVHAVLFAKGDANAASARVKFVDVYNDSDVVASGKGCSGRKINDHPTQDSVPSSNKSFKDLKGTQAGYTDWLVVENDYPVPTVRPVRLIGYQSSYATDVTKNGKETYSIRLIAALNDTFYTYAGFENIIIAYKDGNGDDVVVPKADYFCKYAYHNVHGVDKNGVTQTYAASDYYADHLIALEITGIPEGVTEFTVTLNAFAGNGDVSFAGLMRTVKVSVATQ